ncbi:MAG: hypothetical protein M3P33_01725 [bacterium]|nr:hypothetical protein [bacterium]
MLKNKDQVIVLPKMSKKDKGDFLCPCPVCSNKYKSEQNTFIQVEEVKKMVHELLDTTSLSMGDFHIDITYPNVGTEKFIKEFIRIQKENIKVNPHKNLSPVLVAMREMLEFTFKFNSLYRHPYICDLQETSFSILKEINPLISLKSQSSTKVWQLQQLLENLHNCVYVLGKIKRENFIDDEIIQKHILKTNKSKRIVSLLCKQTFLSALENPEFHPSIEIDEYPRSIN